MNILTTIPEITIGLNDNYGVNKETWSNILFEAASDFVDYYIPDKAAWTKIQQDRSLGFWDWWTMEWLRDDAGLVASGRKRDEQYYRADKRIYTFCRQTYDAFQKYLDSNPIGQNETVRQRIFKHTTKA